MRRRRHAGAGVAAAEDNLRVPLPFDAVLLVAFGGPGGLADVRPFLANVLRGRRVPAERVEEVAHHYELFGGVSPNTELTMRQAEALEAALAAAGLPLRVYVGMRNWHPYLRDTLARMSGDGVRRAIGVIAAAQRSYSSCTQYRENVEAARAALHAGGAAGLDVCYVGDWHLAPGFVAANADHVAAALTSLPPHLRHGAELLFTAHSIPLVMADRYPYERQLRESCAAVADLLSRRFERAVGWRLVYQSRSGRPEDPWLEPDVGDELRAAADRGAMAAVVAPIGFVSDHVEVLYDLDVEAAAVARELGLEFRRANAVNTHAAFVDALRDAVAATVARYAGGMPVPLLHPPAQ